MKPKLTIVCGYNNNVTIMECLLNSLKKQTYQGFNLVMVSNTHNDFKSMAEELNYGGSGTITDYIMFVHQDVCFRKDFLKRLVAYLEKLPDLGVAGLAGKDYDGMKTNISHFIPMERAGHLSKPTEVQTLDGLMLIVKKDTFKKVKFDEQFGWHLYDVDYCLSVKERGLVNYAIPLWAYHRSNGVSILNYSYYDSLVKLIAKHGKQQKIYTTCGDWNTMDPLWKHRLMITLKMMKKRIKLFWGE